MTSIPQEMIMELFLSNPTGSLLQSIDNKDLAIRLLKELPNSATKMYFFWLRDKKESRISVLRAAIREGKEDIFFTLIKDVSLTTLSWQPKDKIVHDIIKYNRINMFKYLIEKGYEVDADDIFIAVEYGHTEMYDFLYDDDSNPELIATAAVDANNKELLDLMITKGITNWNILAYRAAVCGHVDLFKKIITIIYERNIVTSIDQMAEGAAKGGKQVIVDIVIAKGASGWNWMVTSAARNGHSHIVHDMIKRGVYSYSSIAISASVGGHSDLLLDMIKRAETNNSMNARTYDIIATNMTKFGNLELVKDILKKGNRFDIDVCNEIAEKAAKGGHKDIVLHMISLGIRNLGPIVTAAAKGGHKDIADLIVKKIYTRYCLE